MREAIRPLRLVALLAALAVALPAAALDEAGQREFRRIGALKPNQLLFRAKGEVEKAFPGEEWKSYGFPRYVYTDESVETGYKIAVKRPELLAKVPCACFCDAMGHKSLAYCFLKGGRPGDFDDHASTCNICVTQAMLSFLWSRIGANDTEILAGMKELYPLE